LIIGLPEIQVTVTIIGTLVSAVNPTWQLYKTTKKNKPYTELRKNLENIQTRRRSDKQTCAPIQDYLEEYLSMGDELLRLIKPKAIASFAFNLAVILLSFILISLDTRAGDWYSYPAMPSFIEQHDIIPLLASVFAAYKTNLLLTKEEKQFLEGYSELQALFHKRHIKPAIRNFMEMVEEVKNQASEAEKSVNS
jgi:hypothetical protein